MASAGTLTVDIAANVARLQSDMQRVRTITQRGFGDIERAAVSVRNTLAGVFGGLSAAVLTRGVITASREIDRLNTMMEAASGGAALAGKNFEFIGRITKQLGVDFNVTAESFAKFAASSRGTALEGEATRQIFQSLANAGAQLGLRSDELSGALVAVSQIMSKGKVSAEELRGQLGERLPGAFQIAARAMGVTTAELDKMLSQGQLMADQFLPKFAAELDRTFGGGRFDRTANELARLGNAWEEFQRKVINTDAVASAIRYVTELFEGFTSSTGRALKFWQQEIQAAFGTGLDADILRTIKRIEEVERKMENARSISSATGGLIGKGAVDESAKQLDALNYRLELLQKQKEELAKPPEQVPTQLPVVQVSASVARDVEKTKKTGIEITSVFEEWYDKIGQFRDGIGGVNGLLEQTELKAGEITDVFEELRNKRLDEEVINPTIVDNVSRVSDAGRELGLTFESAFEDAAISGKNFGDVLMGVFQDIQRMALRQFVTKPLFEGLFGGGAGGGAGLFGSLFSGFFHGGGIVGGTPTFSRSVPALAFAGAPRYHSGGIAGLRPDEVPAILQKGEVVLPKGSSGGSGSSGLNVVINNNAPNTEVTAQERRGPGGETMLEIMVLEKMKGLIASGRLDKSMNAAYGARRTGVTR
jgi:tape measure domain-containing protein